MPSGEFSNYFAEWPIFGQVIMLYTTGAHLLPFWFIPMIILFYIAAPILLWMDRHSKTYWTIPFLLAISVIIPRPYNDDNTLQAFVHFFSVYTLGMFSCHYQERLFSITKRIWPSLVLIIVILIAFETFIAPSPFYLNILSKSILCILLIYFLWYIDAYIPKQLHYFMGMLADLSFGIYFIHYYFIKAYFILVYKYLGPNLRWSQGPLVVLLLFVLTMCFYVVSLIALKNVLGKNSRFIVGC